jgi:hypothetical protein
MELLLRIRRLLASRPRIKPTKTMMAEDLKGLLKLDIDIPIPRTVILEGAKK